MRRWQTNTPVDGRRDRGPKGETGADSSKPATASNARMRPYRAGDVILFRGEGPLSMAIALGTCLPSQWVAGCAPSHVGVVADYRDRPMLFESTTLCNLDCEILKRPVKGVQCHDIGKRLAFYRGRAWVMRVSDDWAPLTRFQSERLTRFCVENVGAEYDFDGLPRNIFEHLFTFLRPPKRHTVCSRFVSRAEVHASLVAKSVVPDGISPGYIARQWPRTEIFMPPEEVPTGSAL